MFEIAAIREQLNELAFQNGERAVSLGFVSELFPNESSAEVEIELRRLDENLRKHDLLLERRGDELDELYAAQTLKYRAIDLTWMASGMQWVARITTVALEMVAPAVIGMWLDQKLGVQFLGVLGLIFGVPLGIWHLLKITRHDRGEGQ
ncbi:MAG: AtpZ/AtpI family protein [Planctomycetota bacterium]